MAKNPYFVATPPPVSDATRAALRALLVSYLKLGSVAQVQAALLAAGVPVALVNLVAALDTIPDTALQAVHPLLADPTVWALVKGDLGL